MKKRLNRLNLLLLSLLVFAVACSGPRAVETPDAPVAVPDMPAQVAELPEPLPEPSLPSVPTKETVIEPTTVEIDMTAKRWEWDPSTITVNEGDKVILHIRSIDVTHGFALAAFGINEQLKPDETVDVTFIADKKGTYTFACTVFCGSGHSGMTGTFIVE